MHSQPLFVHDRLVSPHEGAPHDESHPPAGEPCPLAELRHAGYEAWWEEVRATYYGMCVRVDAQAGMVLDALRERGIYDDTAFFFFPTTVTTPAITSWWKRPRICSRTVS